MVKPINKMMSIKLILNETKNTIMIRFLKCLFSVFRYFAEIITQDEAKYESAICPISNLEITEESDPFQLLNILEKKPHGFQVIKNHKKKWI